MKISEIAKLAGVSSAAVSRYFNDGYISEEKREAIRKVVEETGYRPSIQAQTLRTKKTKTIGVIVPRIESSSMSKVVAGITSVLEGHNYRVLLSATGASQDKELEYLSIFDDKEVDGVILLATILTSKIKNKIKSMSVPVVLIGQRLAGEHCIYHDDYHAFYDLTKHMIDRGRTNLAYIGVLKEDKAVGSERYKAVADAMKDSGLELTKEHYAIGGFDVDSGYEGMAKLYAADSRVDGVICATDRIAIGALKLLKEKGVSLPKDCMLAGQGDNIFAECVTPGLTSLKYYYEESGSRAAKMVLELINKNEVAVNEVKLGYLLVERESTASF